MRIALFITCVNDVAYPATGIAVTRILRRLGHTVDFPTRQTCCGQMHANTGYRAEAMPMVRNYVDVFDGYDAVVVPSGSCTAMIRDQYPHLHPPARVGGRPHLRAVRAARRRPRRHRRRRRVPGDGHLPPHLPRPADAAAG